MSYCRFGDADVYVYENIRDDSIHCCACALIGAEAPEGWDFTAGRQSMVEHLSERRAAGHHVPSTVFERLAEEIESGAR